MISGQIKVLMVEDNPADARIIKEAFGRRPTVELMHVTRLDEACARLSDGRPDVVLLDLSLPDAQGIESVQRIRDTAPEMPIVVTTGLDDESVAVQALREGAQDYLVKGQVNGPL